MTDKQPAEWALKMAEEILQLGLQSHSARKAAIKLEARFGPVLEAAQKASDRLWSAGESDVACDVDAALEEFRKGTP